MKGILLSVDYGRTLGNLVLGRYEGIDDDIVSANFPTKKSGVAELNALMFPAVGYSPEILAQIKQRNFRAGDIYELAHLAIQHPEEVLKGPIVALGSIYNWHFSRRPGTRWVPVLRGGGSKLLLFLRLEDYGRSWNSSFRFLAFES